MHSKEGSVLESVTDLLALGQNIARYEPLHSTLGPKLILGEPTRP